MQQMTETERKVIDILTNYGVAPDERAAIHAVDQAMGWATADSLNFVEGLKSRGLVQLTPVISHSMPHDPKWQWKEGSALR
jgi:hypothetical protein